MTTPANVRGGVAVQLLTRNRMWVSPLLPPAAAQLEAHALRSRVADIGDGPGLVAFRCAGGRTIDVRARELVSIELSPSTTAPAPDAEQQYRPVVPEPVALTAEEIADRVIRQ